MSAEALKFEDNFFSYSFNNFHVFIVKEPEEAAAQVYRTLKLGGIAVVTSWAEKPFENDIPKVHEATRGLDASHVCKVRDVWKNASHLVSVLEEAGFNNIETETYDVILKINNVEYWSKLAWSFLGAPNGPAGGWVEKDEERLDEAVGIVYDALLKNEKVESDGAGGAKIRMTATSVIAKK
jgi:ubiquinone/menaquinone biosynthesis C-methylase UbiE